MSYSAIKPFDSWQPGYGGAVITVNVPGTTTPVSLFTDTALTVSAANPQTLDSVTIGDFTYGKFTVPVYAGVAWKWSDQNGDKSAVFAPGITTLVDENASDAKVTPTGASVATRLDDILNRVIHVRDYGEFLPTSDGDASASTNNATLTSAIGIASGNNGGRIILPTDTHVITQFTLPAGVILDGGSRGGCILQSQEAGKIVTITGEDAGLANMTLDGVNLVALSTGVYAKSIDQIHFDDVTIKRFAKGIDIQGGREFEWRNFYISNCAEGAILAGDNDAGGGADGDEYRHNEWNGGIVDLCTTSGVTLTYVDKKIWHNTLRDVGFDSNTGTALIINGARHTIGHGCWWKGNTANLTINDDSDTSKATENTVVGFHLMGGAMEGGTVTFIGKCQDVIFEQMELTDVDFTLTIPDNPILFIDCIEDALVTISGDGVRYVRQRRILGNHPTSSGQTTNVTPTTSWSFDVAPGQRGLIHATIVGNERTGEDHGQYFISRPFHRPGSTLPYDAQTADFTVGLVVTGGTSGATALIIADSDSGATGTLTLREIAGVFENNETITDSSTGSATVNGTITDIDVALLGSTTPHIAAQETNAGWAADFVVSGGELQVQVTGIAANTIDWVISCELVLN